MQPLTTQRNFEQASAMAFAHINDIQHWCYDYAHLSAHDVKDNLYQYYLSAFTTYDELSPCPTKYRNQVVTVALYEMTMPHKSTINKYTWSGKQRAIACGISQPSWSRHHLSKYVEYIIDDITNNAKEVTQAVNDQLYKITS